MPDTKLTLPSLREHLRKNLIVYLVGIIVVLMLSNLLWTTTTPRVPDDQAVVICLADSYSRAEVLEGLAARVLERAQAGDDTLRKVEFQNMMFADPSSDYTGVMVMLARLSTGEIDAFLAGPAAMDSLVNSGAILPLDDFDADGWLDGYDLEPYYATLTDEETGESETFLAGYRLDALDILAQTGAFNNDGGFLAVTSNGTNLDATLKVVDILMDELTKEAANDRAEG